ncbi:RNA polymerase sigma factor [Pendulispora brunnea]|uniref:RNA polymerase sigma factor n=1 Tax=Pendulispora brunnea TaxID=2905690 RepID=A0ABZ2KGB3_9BACT
MQGGQQDGRKRAPQEGEQKLDRAMDRYAQGEDAAFAVVYDELSPRLYGYLLRQTRSRERAEDLVQQTFLRIHRARGHFMAGSAVTPWAFAIARRLLIDSVRRGRREVIGVDDDEEKSEAGSADGSSASPEAWAEANQVAQALGRELERLPENQRVAFELVKQEGLSLREAAAVLGTTVAAVKLRAHRAYAALRVSLGAVLPAEDDGAVPGAGPESKESP